MPDPSSAYAVGSEVTVVDCYGENPSAGVVTGHPGPSSLLVSFGGRSPAFVPLSLVRTSAEPPAAPIPSPPPAKDLFAAAGMPLPKGRRR